MKAAVRLTGRKRFDAADSAVGIGPERARAQGRRLPDAGPGSMRRRGPKCATFSRGDGDEAGLSHATVNVSFGDWIGCRSGWFQPVRCLR